jgi:hypothetical protein
MGTENEAESWEQIGHVFLSFTHGITHRATESAKVILWVRYTTGG